MFRMGTYGHDIQSAMIEQINIEMEAKGWKQPELSKQSGISRSTLHRYMAGERDIPLPVFGAISEALGVTYAELATRAQALLDGKNVR